MSDNFSTAELLFYVTVNLCLSLVSGVPHFFFRTTPLSVFSASGKLTKRLRLHADQHMTWLSADDQQSSLKSCHMHAWTSLSAIISEAKLNWTDPNSSLQTPFALEMGVLRTKRALAGLVSSLQPVNTVYSHNAVARDQWARVQLGQTVARLVQCESMNSLYSSHLFIWEDSSSKKTYNTIKWLPDCVL